MARLKAPRLRQLREAAAHSQESLAKAAGVGVATVIRLEGGSSGYPATIRRLAAALGVKPADLQA